MRHFQSYYTKEKDFLSEFLWIELVFLMIVFSSYIHLFFFKYVFSNLSCILRQIFSLFFSKLYFVIFLFSNFWFNKFTIINFMNVAFQSHCPSFDQCCIISNHVNWTFLFPLFNLIWNSSLLAIYFIIMLFL